MHRPVGDRSTWKLRQNRRLNYDRYHNWDDQQAVPAAFAFDGPAYKGLQADGLDDVNLEYLQQHLRILCGLYGALKPLDALKPYR